MDQHSRLHIRLRHIEDSANSEVALIIRTSKGCTPAIKDGEMITVEPIQAPDIKHGDIVLYRSTNGVTADRVLRIDGRAKMFPVLILRGDASTTLDQPVAWQQVLGRVAAVERNSHCIRLTGKRSKLLHARRVLAYSLKSCLYFSSGTVV
jgi:hypothetical protein